MGTPGITFDQMNAPKPEPKFSFEKRWHPELTRFGHVQVSTFFLEHYHHLQPYPLTYEEAMFIIHLIQYKWGADAPFPAYATLAERMHISVKTARRLAASIQKKKYLVRKFRTGQTNVFELDALMEALAWAARNPTSSKKHPSARRPRPGSSLRIAALHLVAANTAALATALSLFSIRQNHESYRQYRTRPHRLRHHFGAGSIQRLGSNEALAVETLSTGSLAVDVALGAGGLPLGRIVEIYGPESSGKTTFCLSVLAEAQRRGGVGAIIDVEHTTT